LPPIKKSNRIESAIKRKPFDFKLGKSQVSLNNNYLNNNNTISEENKEDQSLKYKNQNSHEQN
jgi:hypothetical protein